MKKFVKKSLWWVCGVSLAILGLVALLLSMAIDKLEDEELGDES